MAVNGEKAAYRWGIGILIGVLLFVGGFLTRDVTLGADVNDNVQSISMNKQEIEHVKESAATNHAIVDMSLQELKEDIKDLRQWMIDNL